MLISNLLLVTGVLYVFMDFMAFFLNFSPPLILLLLFFAIFTFTYTLLYRYVLFKTRKKPNYRLLVIFFHVFSLLLLIVLIVGLLIFSGFLLGFIGFVPNETGPPRPITGIRNG